MHSLSKALSSKQSLESCKCQLLGIIIEALKIDHAMHSLSKALSSKQLGDHR